MDRSPLYLAALASAAVPGLDPATVEALPSEPGQLFDVAFVQDTQHRRWVVRAPRTAAAGAQMDITATLLALLARRLPFSVPTPKGFAALKEGGRACVYPYLPGQNLDFSSLPPGPGLAAELGRTIAALHNADHQLFDEAGLPAYDPDQYRSRRLAELDRAAATGLVPTGLLTRWEGLLEDVSLWRFAPTPTHGDLTGDQVLAVFDDEEDAATGRIRALTGWEDAKVADPADDFAALVAQAPPAAQETVLEAYAHARVERPDPNLERRARLAAETTQLTALMTAVTAGDQRAADRCAAALRRLDERLHDLDLNHRSGHDGDAARGGDHGRTALRPARTGPVLVPPRLGAEDEDDDVSVMFAPTATSDDAPADRQSAVLDGLGEVQDSHGDEQDGPGDERGAVAVPATTRPARQSSDEPTTQPIPQGAPPAAATGSRASVGESDLEGLGVGEAEAGEPGAEEPGVEAPARGDAPSSSRAGPAAVEGPDPGPEFEPGFTPPRRAPR